MKDLLRRARVVARKSHLKMFTLSFGRLRACWWRESAPANRTTRLEGLKHSPPLHATHLTEMVSGLRGLSGRYVMYGDIYSEYAHKGLERYVFGTMSPYTTYPPSICWVVTKHNNRSDRPTDLRKKDWIEQPIVLAPTKLKSAAPSCWDHFSGKGLLYAMGKITFEKNVPSSLFSGITCRSRVASKWFSRQCLHAQLCLKVFPNKMAAANFLWLHFLNNRSSILSFF